jgi:hypothetical protein
MEPLCAASELPIGDPARRTIGRAVLASLIAAVAFLAFSWLGKELRALYVHEPWQDDPYDAVVSASFWLVPSLVGLGALRVALCRRSAPLPLRRALVVVRVGRLLAGAVLLTLGGDWAAVALGVHRRDWTATTTVLAVLLAVATALGLVAAREVRRAGRELRRRPSAPSQPDWLADALALAERETIRLGPWRDGALTGLRWLDTRLVARIRRHPLLAALAVSLAGGVVVSAPQVLSEGYAPAMALFYVGVTASGMFAFLAIAGAHLRLVGRREAGGAVRALVVACTSVPLTVAFRGALWWLVGAENRDASLAQLAVLLLLVAASTGVLTLAAEWVLAALRRSRRAR